jgi:tRNA A-37 threonylcarbamoyl transferase component Bud32
VWPNLNGKQRQTWAVRLAILLGRMHHFGCMHGDLKWNNILVLSAEKAEKVLLCDLDGSKIDSGLNYPKASIDLRRFLKDMQTWDNDVKRRIMFLHIWKKWAG